MRNRENRSLGRVGDVRVCRHVIARDGDRVIGSEASVIHEEIAIGRVLRMKGQAEESAFTAVIRDARGDVEKWSRQNLRAVPDANLSALLHDKDASRAISGVHDAEGNAESRGDLGDP